MRVLMVDDDEINLAIYREIVNKIEGCEAVCFSVSEDALKWCGDNDPDLIVVDYVMPGIDGLEFIERFRSIAPTISRTPVIMITGDQEKSVRYKALEVGANDFLNKPVDKIEMLVRVRNLLEIGQSRRQLENRAEWLAGEIRKATAQIVEREREVIYRLTRAAEFRDSATGMHIVRIGQYSKAIAEEIGLPKAECEMLLLAAPMHDVGKVATPDNILLKPGPLTPNEYDIMKLHPIAGYEILKNSESPLLQMAAEIALTHHERWDGTGYPYGTKGLDIPLSGRICAVVDVFDALISVRPYKNAWTVEDASAEIQARRGTFFDPNLVDTFLAILPRIVQLFHEFSDSRKDIADPFAVASGV